jgi:Tol biopolymer transport system component
MKRFRSSVACIGASLCAANLAFCAPVRESNESASLARCEYGPVQSLGPMVNSPAFDGSPTVSADETELFFTSERKGLLDLFVSTQSGRAAPWTEPVNLGPPIDDPSAGDFSLRLSSDGGAMYFASTRDGGFGRADLYVARRESKRHPWGPARNLGPRLNTDAFEAFPTPGPDGTVLYFNRSTTFDSRDSDLWVSSRAGPAGVWSEPKRAPAPINSDGAEFSPAFSSDGLSMYFASDRDGPVEVWVSRRGDQSQQWGTPEKLGAEVNVPGSMTLAPFISSDQRSLYFMQARPDRASGAACTPMTCFNRVDLYVAGVNCR